MRLHDCWCRTCRSYGTEHADDADLQPCKAGWKWKNRDVYRHSASGVRADRGRLEDKGRELAQTVKPGDLVAVQYVTHRGRKADGHDCYWVGVAVNQGNGQCTYRVPAARVINGVGFDKNEIAVAVRWLEREDTDEERRTFRMGDDDKTKYGKGEPCLYFNAAHLRRVGFMMQRITPKVQGRDTRSAKQRNEQARWRMPATTHTSIEKDCYY